MAAALALVLGACGPRPDGSSGREASNEEEKLSPQERKYVEAAQPFFNAVAARDYRGAFALLSSHARARMSVNQFVPADDDAVFARQEAQPRRDVTVEGFAALMGGVEREHGQPAAVEALEVFESDPKVLSGQGDKLETMFAIGNMPASIPADIRRASLRGQVRTALSAAQMAAAAKAHETTVEELQKNPDFKPYFTLKLVLVEEGGALRVGYFEFLPPSMLD